jgi:modification methylase
MKALNDDLQMRSDWTLPLCTGGERLKDAEGRKVHATQKPEALLWRVLLAASNPGQLVVDPFFGSGTTGAVAKRMGRRWLGFEREPVYAAAARQRIARVQPLGPEELDTIKPRRSEPRIPFGWLVERGLIEPGTVLFDPARRWTAKVRADGSLISADHKGSIHKVGAAVQGAPACNGWTFWHLNVEGRPVPLDVLRQKLRAELH